jgi:hypothetical protein
MSISASNCRALIPYIDPMAVLFPQNQRIPCKPSIKSIPTPVVNNILIPFLPFSDRLILRTVSKHFSLIYTVTKWKQDEFLAVLLKAKYLLDRFSLINESLALNGMAGKVKMACSQNFACLDEFQKCLSNQRLEVLLLLRSYMNKQDHLNYGWVKIETPSHGFEPIYKCLAMHDDKEEGRFWILMNALDGKIVSFVEQKKKLFFGVNSEGIFKLEIPTLHRCDARDKEIIKATDDEISAYLAAAKIHVKTVLINEIFSTAAVLAYKNTRASC